MDGYTLEIAVIFVLVASTIASKDLILLFCKLIFEISF